MNPVSLVVITICRDNTDDLVKTCFSVSNQSRRPSRHLIIDGSRPENAECIKQSAAVHRAEYFWQEPEGIYAAMRAGLREVADSDFVWFVNATDSLASTEAVLTVTNAIENAEPENQPSWLIGQTVVLGELPHLMKYSPTGHLFSKWLAKGEVGLPHPSTVVRASVLREVAAFDRTNRISEDYEMGLKIINQCGPPMMVPVPLSVYDESGESSKRAWSNVLHKSEARIRNQAWWATVAEPYRITRAIRREFLRRRMLRHPSNWSLWQKLGWTAVPEGWSPIS